MERALQVTRGHQQQWLLVVCTAG